MANGDDQRQMLKDFLALSSDERAKVVSSLPQGHLLRDFNSLSSDDQQKVIGPEPFQPPNPNVQARTAILSNSPLTRGIEGLYSSAPADRASDIAAAEAEENKHLIESGETPGAVYMKPGQTATAIGGMLAAGSVPVAPLATGLTLGGSAVGRPALKLAAEKMGANPGEAEMWGTTGGIVGGLLGSEGGVRLQSEIPWMSLWNRLTGKTQYAANLEAAKNANLARYRLSEQGAQSAIDEAMAKVAEARAALPAGEAGQWADLNTAVGATPRSIRIGKGVSDLSMSYGNAGRGLLREGFDSETLSKLTPPQQAAMIGPKWQAAGKAVQDAADKATEDGTMLDAGKSVTNVIKNRIADPVLQEKAINLINQHQKDLGIENMREATPTEALALRQALRNDANFGPNSTTDSMKGIGRALYSAVSNDLHDAVPAMKAVDQHYGDMAEAVNAVQKQTQRYAAGQWKPPQTQVEKAQAKVPSMPNVSPYTPLPAPPSTLSQFLSAGKNLAPWMLGGGTLGGGIYELERLRRLAATQ